MKIPFTIAFFLFPFLTFAQFLLLESETNPTDLPWCYEKTEKDNACYDGISYAFLIEKNVAVENYPVTKADFLLIEDSYK